MASEYLKWKYRDVKPDEPPPERSRKEKLANWFYYNKWWLAVGAVLAVILGGILWDALGIGKVRPDYIFAYIGNDPLSGDCTEALERELAALGQDVNGDGRVTVEMRTYALDRSGDAETVYYYNYAADVALVADITNGESYFFLAEDPDSVQRAYQILANADGTAPEENDHGTDGKVFRWRDCPVLAGLAVEQGPLEDLYIGRRCFYKEEQAEGQEANSAFWAVITEGARR